MTMQTGVCNILGLLKKKKKKNLRYYSIWTSQQEQLKQMIFLRFPQKKPSFNTQVFSRKIE